jgi:hypothetical protein
VARTSVATTGPHIAAATADAAPGRSGPRAYTQGRRPPRSGDGGDPLPSPQAPPDVLSSENAGRSATIRIPAQPCDSPTPSRPSNAVLVWFPVWSRLLGLGDEKGRPGDRPFWRFGLAQPPFARGCPPASRPLLAARTALALARRRPIILRPRALATLPAAVAAVGRRRRIGQCRRSCRQRERTRKHQTRESPLHLSPPFRSGPRAAAAQDGKNSTPKMNRIVPPRDDRSWEQREPPNFFQGSTPQSPTCQAKGSAFRP